MTPSSTTISVHVSCAWGGYTWSVKRAWKTSAMPGTPGTHARTWLTSRTYKNRGHSPGTLDTMRFDTKIVVVVRDDLENWQRLNVTAFLASGITANPDLHGEP